MPRTMLSARDIGPELGRSVTMEYDTAGGPIAMLVYPRSCKVSVLEEDRKPKWIEADVVVSPVEREVVLSDALIEELGIIILSPKRGHWRFTDDPVDRVRSSYRPHYW
ncbi:MAG TPA: hypothetical protein ENF80_00980 [Thermofilum sp.]|nr:hypothetical protein [Thermofilum sp.]